MAALEQDIYDCEWKLQSVLDSYYCIELVVHPQKASLEAGVMPLQGILFFDVELSAYYENEEPRFTARSGDVCLLNSLEQFRDGIISICRNGKEEVAKLQAYDGFMDLSIEGTDAIHSLAVVRARLYDNPSYRSLGTNWKPKKNDSWKHTILLDVQFEIDASSLEPVIQKIEELLRLLESAS